MKKLNYLLLGAAGLMMASCSQDDLLNDAANDGLYHITVKLPSEVGTRALGNGLTADNLYMAVYDADNDNSLIYDDLTLNFGGKISTDVGLSLVKGKTYNIAFFALSPKAAEDKVYNFSSEDGQFTVDYSKMDNRANNTDAYDCFFKLYNIKYDGTQAGAEVLLNRPVAQINWGTNDLTEEYPAIIDHFGVGGEYIATGFNTKAYNTWNFFGGTQGSGDVVTGDTYMSTVQLDLYTPPTDELFPVTGYDYVALQYVLAPQTETLYNLTLTISDSNQTPAPAEVISNVVNVDNAPVQANYRTNIYGSLLSEDFNLTVTKDKEWGTPDYEVVYINGLAYIVIKNDDPNNIIRKGGNIMLGQNYEYNNNGYLIFNTNTNLDLNGFTLSSNIPGTYDATVTVGGSATDVTISNGTIAPLTNSTSSDPSLIFVRPVNNIQVTLNNITAVGMHPVWMNAKNANAEGSKITINGGTYNSQSATSPAVYVSAYDEVNTAGQVVINGGTFGQAGITNPYLLNVLDRLRTNKDPRDFIIVYGGTFINFNPADNGAEGNPTNFVADGYKAVASTVGNDTYYTVVPETSTVVTTTADLASAIANAKSGDTILVGAGENLSIPVNFNTNVTIKGLGADLTKISTPMAYNASNGAKLVFEDLTLQAFVNNSNHTSMGFQGAASVTFNNVTLKGQFYVFTGNAAFNNCTFEYDAFTQRNSEFQLCQYSSGTTTITNCVMNCGTTGAVAVISPWNLTEPTEVGGNMTINGLTVNATGENEVAVVNINTKAYKTGGTVNINNVTFDASMFPMGLWNQNNGEDDTNLFKVFVNGAAAN